MTQQEQYYWQQMQRQNTLRAYYNNLTHTQYFGIGSDQEPTQTVAAPAPKQKFSLNVTKNTQEWGNVEVTVDNPSSYDTSANKYVEGAIVSLRAIPSDGCEFIGWECDGNLIGSQPTINFTVNRDISVNALFDAMATEEYSDPVPVEDASEPVEDDPEPEEA